MAGMEPKAADSPSAVAPAINCRRSRMILDVDLVSVVVIFHVSLKRLKIPDRPEKYFLVGT
jgi:hypothetical protein